MLFIPHTPSYYGGWALAQLAGPLVYQITQFPGPHTSNEGRNEHALPFSCTMLHYFGKLHSLCQSSRESSRAFVYDRSRELMRETGLLVHCLMGVQGFCKPCYGSLVERASCSMCHVCYCSCVILWLIVLYSPHTIQPRMCWLRNNYWQTLCSCIHIVLVCWWILILILIQWDAISLQARSLRLGTRMCTINSLLLWHHCATPLSFYKKHCSTLDI